MNMTGGYIIIIMCFIIVGFCERTLAVDGDLSLQKNTSDQVVDVRQSSQRDITRLVDYILGSEPGIQGRTFGMKRIQFMMMPMMFKMGLMTTLLVVLTVISLKGLTVGIILLVLKLSAFFGKFYALLQPQQHMGWSSSGQPVHLHVHSPDGGIHQHPYNGWEAPTSNNFANEHYYYKG